jgi:hypothetical protein
MFELSDHYEVAAAFPRGSRVLHIPQPALDWRENRARCARCGDKIYSFSRMVTRGGECFHDMPCARLHDRRQARQATSSPAQTVIGTVAGVALPFGVPCSIEHRTADGDVFSRSEQFKHDAFAESIQRGAQALKIDHAATVPGVLTLFEGPDLRFRFRMHNSVVGLRLLDHVRRGEARGASIAFRTRRSHYGFGNVEVIDVAELNEVSVCVDGKPAWYSTRVWEEV